MSRALLPKTPFLAVQRADGTRLPLQVRRCSSFLCRLRGLTFRRKLPRHEALLLIEPAEGRLNTAIHMLFVFFPIAAIWINAEGEVVDKVLARPFALYYAPARPACYTLEATPEWLEAFTVGERVAFVAAPAQSESR